MNAFYQISIVPFDGVLLDDGEYYGIEFVDGIAYLSPKELGGHECQVAAQTFGHDPHFQVKEISEADYLQALVRVEEPKKVKPNRKRK